MIKKELSEQDTLIVLLKTEIGSYKKYNLTVDTWTLTMFDIKGVTGPEHDAAGQRLRCKRSAGPNWILPGEKPELCAGGETQLLSI